MAQTQDLHFFTSVSCNYLPKARILAKSIRQHRPAARFTLVLGDALPPEIDVAAEPFDEILTIEQLGVPVDNLNAWIFGHEVVELCTAIKGQALVKLLEDGSEKVIYLDPDIAVFSDLSGLDALLDQHDVVLTPHQTDPESNEMDILNNEVCSMQHGIYNFGFFAVRRSDEGLRFARWWRDRLVRFCMDSIPNGIFTDQRWGDFGPAFFSGCHILREPNYNVSTWNLSGRKVEKVGDFSFTVNGKPLQFYHFSGFDSGAQETMLKVYAKDNPALWELREWYIRRMDEEGQQQYGKQPPVYAFYSSGEKIPWEQRFLLRWREDVVAWLDGCDPFDVNAQRSFYNWWQADEERRVVIPLPYNKYKLHREQQAAQQQIDDIKAELEALRAERAESEARAASLEAERAGLAATVAEMRASRSWRWTAFLRKIKG